MAAAGIEGKVGKKTGEDIAGKRSLSFGPSRLLVLALVTFLIFALTALFVLLLLSTVDVVLAPLLFLSSLLGLLLFATTSLFVLVGFVLVQDLFVDVALDAVQRHGIRQRVEIIMSTKKRLKKNLRVIISNVRNYISKQYVNYMLYARFLIYTNLNGDCM